MSLQSVLYRRCSSGRIDPALYDFHGVKRELREPNGEYTKFFDIALVLHAEHGDANIKVLQTFAHLKERMENRDDAPANAYLINLEGIYPQALRGEMSRPAYMYVGHHRDYKEIDLTTEFFQRETT